MSGSATVQLNGLIKSVDGIYSLDFSAEVKNAIQVVAAGNISMN